MCDVSDGLFGIFMNAANKLIENNEPSSWYIILSTMVMMFFWKISSVISFVKSLKMVEWTN